MTRARNPATGRFYRVDEEPKALTAGATVLPSTSIEKLPRAPKGWQTRAWRLWRCLGVLHFPITFKANQVGRMRWNVEVDGTELSADAADAAIAAVTEPMGPREASKRLALNLEIAGQAYYVRAQDSWQVWSATMNGLKEALKGADVIVEALISDPEMPTEPSSGVQAALDTADAIRLMAQMSRNQDRNRLAQRGIILKPKEGQFPEGDDFNAKLQESMTAPLADEYSASAVVPLLVDYPAEFIEKWRHFIVESPYDDKLMDRIEAAIKQLALELDMPPEMLLGNMDSNHWNAWLSSDENYRAHVEPLAVAVAEVYAEAMMAAAEGRTIVVTPDPTELLARRSSVEDAFAALKLGVVGFDYVRETIGATEEDAPSDEEIALILQLTGNAPQAAMPALPAVGEAPSGNGAAGPSNASTPAAPSSNGNGVTADVGESERELEHLARRLTDIDITLLGRLEGMANSAVDHVRSIVEPDDVGVQHAIADEMKRLGKAWNRELTTGRNSLKALGIDSSGPLWDQAQEASVHLLTDEMTAFVTDNLHKTDSEMPALPVLVLRRVLATAGGSGIATVAAVVRNPAPTFQDPQGFALGVLPLRSLKAQDIDITQWRFRYGPLTRTVPFEEHKAVDGQFMTADGETSDGWYPGDHKGCECTMDPVFSRGSSPEEA